MLLLLLLALPRRDRNAVMAAAAGRIVMAGGLVEVRASEECVRPPARGRNAVALHCWRRAASRMQGEARARRKGGEDVRRPDEKWLSRTSTRARRARDVARRGHVRFRCPSVKLLYF